MKVGNKFSTLIDSLRFYKPKMIYVDTRYSCLETDRRIQSLKILITESKCVRHDARILTPNRNDKILKHPNVLNKLLLWGNLILEE